MKGKVEPDAGDHCYYESDDSVVLDFVDSNLIEVHGQQ